VLLIKQAFPQPQQLFHLSRNSFPQVGSI